MKKNLLAFLISFIVMFILGGLWNAIIMNDFYINNSPTIVRPEEDFNLPIIALGYLILSAIMTLIVVKSFNENPKFIRGFIFGATFGLAATLPLYLILWGRWDFPLVYGLVDTLWHLMEQGIGAVVLCKVIYSNKKI
ncbi:DUF2177 family protein [uncultured Psychroserpens sp.]|uniref:DUF2177 family protein n=1 Tax=uncultured Psychroserpens sp. TaxID=255436 RepID=UPI00262FDDFD|nr:DUF2177 family protein [uncultured Psychroserpens sp.]